MSSFIVLPIVDYGDCSKSSSLWYSHRSNYLGVQFFAAFYNTTVASLSTRCRGVLGIDPNGRRLTDGLQLFNFDVDWGPLSIQGVVEKSMKLDMKIMAKEDEIMNKQVDMNSILSALRDRMIALQGTVDGIAVKLDMDPGQPRENDSKSKKSKKAKQAKPEVLDESDGGDLFTRNLLGVKEAMNDKFDMMESKVESIESKVESIEGKVESIEKTMEELKDMLSQLMMRGADVA